MINNNLKIISLNFKENTFYFSVFMPFIKLENYEKAQLFEIHSLEYKISQNFFNNFLLNIKKKDFLNYKLPKEKTKKQLNELKTNISIFFGKVWAKLEPIKPVLLSVFYNTLAPGVNFQIYSLNHKKISNKQERTNLINKNTKHINNKNNTKL
ncbi:hypothetical protein [Mycoplasma phocimorsus]|uniref:hypothetical protein n=1 Tax=Mycoplasma phocimorsus TaxID=3045839 RepID=UPI0024C0445D|nr:hypothetical protein [Mycoplasma phocimorsus]MDJ1646635.1 hypothetical protein [Mycoplasma phocimorsus]